MAATDIRPQYGSLLAHGPFTLYIIMLNSYALIIVGQWA